MRERDSYRVTRTRVIEEHQDVEIKRRPNESTEDTAERVLWRARQEGNWVDDGTVEVSRCEVYRFTSIYGETERIYEESESSEVDEVPPSPPVGQMCTEFNEALARLLSEHAAMLELEEQRSACIYEELDEEVEAAQRSFRKMRGVFELNWGTRLLGRVNEEG